ncbi:inositol monophosphatase [Alphaproteobacteria bacterium]|nr:inositol monophosphatase [Alphaproteobacteria bacterium]
MSDSADLHIIRKAAEKASYSIARDFGELERLQSSKKGVNSFVAATIKSARERITEMLTQFRPDFHFLENTPNPKIKNAFIVNPICGLHNFKRGIPYFSINIALSNAGEIVSGITLEPLKGDCFCAQAGGGTFLGNKTRLRVSSRDMLDGALISVNGFNDLAKFSNNNLEIRKTGSVALDLVYLAAGKYDAVIAKDIEFSEIASGILQTKESGGFVNFSVQTNGQYSIFAASSLRLLNTVSALF